jgi:hypothetical protein
MGASLVLIAALRHCFVTATIVILDFESSRRFWRSVSPRSGG